MHSARSSPDRSSEAIGSADARIEIDFLIAEHGEAVSVMRAIKKAIDPDNIMNPGKILRI